MPDNQWQRVNAAFSKQAAHFDDDDFSNQILQRWRERIYNHVDQFLKPNSKILEINAGTGIDAVRFASQGHFVHATDLSDGMIEKIKEKISKHSFRDKITVQQISFENLGQMEGKFDYAFSNFGGLNCTADLTKITKQFSRLLSEKAFVTWVIMPKIAPWEWTWVFKGQFKKAFRRFRKNGVVAHLEGETFITYYYSINEIKRACGENFHFVKSEGLGIFSPPPSAENFVRKFSYASNFLNRIDKSISKFFPLNESGDHIIVTFQRK